MKNFFFPDNSLRVECKTEASQDEFGNVRIRRSFYTFRSFWMYFKDEVLKGKYSRQEFVNTLGAWHSWMLNPQRGALAFDAEADSKNGTGNTTLTFAHTVTGANPLLIVGGGVNGTTTFSGITYNLVAMTSIATSYSATEPSPVQFGLINPATGANNVVGTVGLAVGMGLVAVSFSGADQTTGWHNSNTAIGSNTAVTVTITSAVGEIVIDCGVNNTSGTTPTVGAGQTQRANFNTFSTAGGVMFVSTEPGAASVVMSWTTANDNWRTMGVSVMAAASSNNNNLLILGAG